MKPTRVIREVLASSRQCAQRFPRALTQVLVVGLALAGFAAAQAVPLAVTSTSKQVGTVNGNAGHIAANTAGDLFYVSQTDNTAYWLPRGTTHPIALMTGLQGARSVAVDASNNVYVGNPYANSPTIIEDPYVNGTYATGIAYGSVPACSSPTPTSPCVQYGSGASVTNYYYQALDLGFDAAGNTYVIDIYTNTNPAGTSKANAILKWSFSKVTGAFVASYVSQFLPENANAQIAVSPNGDVYYADGTNLYYIAAGATTATIITTAAMTNPAGVSADQYGDIFVTNSNVPYAIIEIPALNGVAQLSKAFTFSQGYSANGIALDQLGDYFYTGYSGGTNLNQGHVYSFNLGSAAVGTPVSGTAQTISLLFTATATPATIGLSGASPGFSYVPGSCAAGTTYSAGSSCNINVNYTPTAVGLQRGSVTLADATGNSLVSVFLSGIGLGAAQTSDPGTLSVVGAGLKTPQSIRVDSANNVYIADPGQNAVLRFAQGSTAPTSIGTGLVAPSSVSLDNSGNVFIADSGNGRIVEVPNLGGTVTNSAQTVIASYYTSGTTSKNLGTSLSIALDPSGNLFVADATNAVVIKYASVDGVPSASANSLVKGVTLTAPSAVASDATGNLFIADTTANTVSEQVYYGKAILNIGSGYSHPSGLATDAAGSLYVADTGNSRLLKIPFESPIFNTNDQYRVDAGIAAPYGVALDASANVYVVDSKNAVANFINRTQGTLALGRANLNNPTSTLNANISNSGNQTLKLGTPAYVATGNTAVFMVSSPSTGGCVNGSSILSGYTCILQASFDPTTTGNFTELLSFSSNALNTTTPSLTLTGTGLNLTATTLKLTQVGTAKFGQPVVVSATISSTLVGTPTGTLSFTVDGASAGTYTVNGNTVQATLTGVTGGPHTIGASYTGDDFYAPSNTTLAITVVQAGSSVAITASGTGVSQNPVSVQPGTLINYQAVVTPGATTIPTGTVTFTAGGVTLGQAGVAPNASNQYVAVISSAALPAGTDTVVATYSGDVNYVSSSATLTVVVGPMEFTSTPASTHLTVSTHGTATTTFQVVSLAGFTGYVGMNCTGLPANTVCGFSPNGFILQPSNLITTQVTDANGNILVPATFGPTNVLLSIMTGTTPIVAPPVIGAGPRSLLSVLLAFLTLMPVALWLRSKGRAWQRATSLLLMVLALSTSLTMFSGCGSSLVGVTPAGTYNVTVTTTSTAATVNGKGSYVGSLAPGCNTSAPAATPSTPTCIQTSTITLVVQ